MEAEVSSPSRVQMAHDFFSPELPPLYQATMFATTGALPLPGELPLEHGIGGCLPHRPRDLTVLFVLDSRVIPSNPAGCGVRKRRPALRERSPYATGLPARAPCLFSFLDTLVTQCLKSSNKAGMSPQENGQSPNRGLLVIWNVL